MDAGPASVPEGRISPTQRDAVIDVLRNAAGDGVIDLEEFGERAGVVYSAQRVEELRAVLSDIGSGELPVLAPPPSMPAPSAPPPAHGPPRPKPQNVVAVMSGAERKGNWRPGARVNAVAFMGGVKLDFRNATLSSEVIEVAAVAIMGGIELVVPEGVPIEVDGFILMGGIDDKTEATSLPGAPLIRVNAAGLWGGVTIRHPSERRQRARADVDAPGEDTVPPVAVAAPAEPAPRQPLTIEDGRGSVEGGTATLLFTDVSSSTNLAETLGDQLWYQVLQEHNVLLREQFDLHRGREIKGQGDGFMVAFNSARRALQCAIGIQRALATHRWSRPDTSLHVRIGVHSGEVIADDGDLFGRNVIMASRIAALAGPDEILASALTKQLADATSDLSFGAAREVQLRGLSGTWTVHGVEWR